MTRTTLFLRYIFALPAAFVAQGIASSLGWFYGGFVPDFLLPITDSDSDRWILAGAMATWAYYYVGFTVFPFVNQKSKWILIIPMYLTIPAVLYQLSGNSPSMAWNAGIVMVFTIYLTSLTPERINEVLGAGKLESD